MGLRKDKFELDDLLLIIMDKNFVLKLGKCVILHGSECVSETKNILLLCDSRRTTCVAVAWLAVKVSVRIWEQWPCAFPRSESACGVVISYWIDEL
jgi:hypothetical protein